MTTAWVGFNVSLRMIICHGLLQLAVLLIIAVDEEEVSKECLLGIVLDLGLLRCIS
jgi:hypothetical protein